MNIPDALHFMEQLAAALNVEINHGYSGGIVLFMKEEDEPR